MAKDTGAANRDSGGGPRVASTGHELTKENRADNRPVRHRYGKGGGEASRPEKRSRSSVKRAGGKVWREERGRAAVAAQGTIKGARQELRVQGEPGRGAGGGKWGGGDRRPQGKQGKVRRGRGKNEDKKEDAEGRGAKQEGGARTRSEGGNTTKKTGTNGRKARYGAEP